MDVERTSTGEIKYPEDIWKVARPIASDYQQAMVISALLLAERQRCAKIASDEATVIRARRAKLQSKGASVNGDVAIAARTAERIAKAIEEGTKP